MCNTGFRFDKFLNFQVSKHASKMMLYFDAT